MSSEMNARAVKANEETKTQGPCAQETDEPKNGVKRKLGADDAEVTKKIAMAAPPLGFKTSAKELHFRIYAQELTDEERAAAKAELRRRHVLYLAALSILVGGYKEIENKTRRHCGYVPYSSTAREVRSQPMREVARFAFTEEHGKMLCFALAEELRERMDDPDSAVLLTDLMEKKSLREVCGLGTRSPVLISRSEYVEQIVKDTDNVNAIIGTDLKECLLRIDPSGDWVRSPEPEECGPSVEAAMKEAKPLRYFVTGHLLVNPVVLDHGDDISSAVYEKELLEGYLAALKKEGYPLACPITHGPLTGNERVRAAVETAMAVAAYVAKYGKMEGPAWVNVRALCDRYTAAQAAQAARAE